MKVLSASFKDFKRFKNLSIHNLPPNARLVMLVGPNGSGKSSVFDGFLQWQRKMQYGAGDEQFEYYIRGRDLWAERQNLWQNQVTVTLDNANLETWDTRKYAFYFRSAYRFEGTFTLNSITRQSPAVDDQSIATMSESDVSVSKNYARLMSKLFYDLHDKKDDNTPKGQWRDQQYKSLQESLQRLFPGLILENPGNILEEGTLFFTKGDVSRFKYVNLSSGEKSTLDLLLDLFVRGSVYNESVYCIDEPEAHMNTNLHGPLLDELYRFVPEQGQLWIATHSIGMIRKAAELSKKAPGSVVFLDFHDFDFDQETTLSPALVNTSFWARNLRTTLADLSELIAPKRVVLCEGARPEPGVRKAEFDAQCYQKIFEKEFPDTLFISVGSSNNIITGGAALRSIINRMASGIEVVTLIDRDERTEAEIVEAQNNGCRVLPLRHIEHYLLADEPLTKLCQDFERPGAVNAVLAGKNQAIADLINRNLSPDDIKKAKGNIYNLVKSELKNTGQKFGSDADYFCRDVMAPRVTPGMSIYTDLKNAIFGAEASG
ncbi:AAA family ATPase [Dankookia sp. GCM10030260]|uniref:AAA family ATPase n=1 Tax=Dankookia sp. GCM10030260 TaxID=3273390 RepID=UPI0036115DEC